MWWLALVAAMDWSAAGRLIAVGRYQDALAQLERVRDRPAAWHVLASKAYHGLNDPARAVGEAETALALDPGNQAAHIQLDTFSSAGTRLRQR